MVSLPTPADDFLDQSFRGVLVIHISAHRLPDCGRLELRYPSFPNRLVHLIPHRSCQGSFPQDLLEAATNVLKNNQVPRWDSADAIVCYPMKIEDTSNEEAFPLPK